MQPVRRSRHARCIKSENEADRDARTLFSTLALSFFRVAAAAACENKLGANARVGVRTGGPALAASERHAADSAARSLAAN